MQQISRQEGAAQEVDASHPYPLVAAVTVTFNPDLEILLCQLEQLPESSLKVWVDNASEPHLVKELCRIADGRSDLLLVLNESNLGLAEALNQGAVTARSTASGCPFLILLDQDTEPGSGGVEALIAAFNGLAQQHPRIGCVGPKLVDVQTGLEHGFHQISGFRWRRRYAVKEPVIPVANLNGSGTLVKFALFEALDGLDGSLFIDHIDTEWAFRVSNAGYELFGVPAVEFRHRMGERTIRFWLVGWRAWPYRSPKRHYYLFRNTVRLLSQDGVPTVWKVWAPVKLAVTIFVHLCFDRNRFEQVKQMAGGLRAGVRHGDARKGLSSVRSASI